MEKKLYGYVWIPKGKFRPFHDYRQIKYGKNRGRFEIQLFAGHPKKVIVDPDYIKRFPREN